MASADPLNPTFTVGWLEYAPTRGFFTDPARVRAPMDKPKVERAVQYVRGNFFAGEDFADLADARARASLWCATTAGLRVHGTTQQRPAQVFNAEEAPLLLPAPADRYDVPLYATAKVHRDHHIEVAKALYSMPGHLIGAHVQVRADAALVKVFHRGQCFVTERNGYSVVLDHHAHEDQRAHRKGNGHWHKITGWAARDVNSSEKVTIQVLGAAALS